jgi:formate dehydrogenase maturation protein FdhE
MPTARTHCPDCNSRAVFSLSEILHHPGVDFFRCVTCQSIWHVPKDKSGPPSRSLLENPTRNPRKRRHQ